MTNSNDSSVYEHVKDLDTVFNEVGMLARIRTIIDVAMQESWTVSDFLKVINHEVNMIKDDVTIHNKKAHDFLIRRELGVTDSAVISSRDYLSALLRVLMARGGQQDAKS